MFGARRSWSRSVVASSVLLGSLVATSGTASAATSLSFTDASNDVVDEFGDPIDDPAGDLRQVAVETAGQITIDLTFGAPPTELVALARFRSVFAGGNAGVLLIDTGSGTLTVVPFNGQQAADCPAATVTGYGTASLRVTVPYSCVNPPSRTFFDAAVLGDGFDVTEPRAVDTSGTGPVTATGVIDGDPATTDRLLTDDPVRAATNASTKVFRTGGFAAQGAVLARADVFADALSGSALTGAIGGPLLFTGKDALPDATKTELRRILVSGDPVYLLGGTAAIGDAVRAELAGMGFVVTRLAGTNRIRTSIAVADEIAPGGGREVFLARSAGPAGDPNGTAAWADSIAIAPFLAGSGGFALVLLVGDTLTAEHQAVLDRIQPARITLLGGTAAISDAVRSQAAALGYTVRRVAGSNRAATAAAIIDKVWQEVGPFSAGRAVTGPRGVAVVNGWASNGWAFGLAGAQAAGAEFMPYVLTSRNTLPAETQAALTSCSGSPEVETWVIGGFTQASSTITGQIDALDPASCG